MVKNNFKIAKTYVSKLPIFNFLTAKQKDSISYNMNTLKYDVQENIALDRPLLHLWHSEALVDV